MLSWREERGGIPVSPFLLPDYDGSCVRVVFRFQDRCWSVFLFSKRRERCWSCLSLVLELSFLVQKREGGVGAVFSYSQEERGVGVVSSPRRNKEELELSPLS